MTGHVQTFLSLLAAYLLGAIPFSLLLGRVACGVDIRKHGSGNVGATNLARVCGKIFFLPAFLLDFSKGALPPLLFPRFVDPTIPPHIFEIALASAPVLGHVYSPYLGFKGGKGVATTAGAMTALMPLVTAAAFAIWLVMFAATKKVCIVGLYVIIGALFMHWVGAKMQQTRLSLISLILLIWGIPFYFFGWEIAKLLIFPCSYLIFCVPLNFLDALSFPLQQAATGISFNILNGIGLECERVGTQLISPYFQLNVEAPCSGLRSLLAMTALTAVYAYSTQKTFIKKWLLFVLSIPIAVAGNIGRIISIAVVSIVSGQKLGAGLYHDWSGYVLFTVAISLMVAVAKLLNVNYRELFSTWKKAYLNRS